MHANLLAENVAHHARQEAESTANFIDELRETKLREIRIQRALGTMIEVDLDSVPLQTALNDMAEQVNIDIVLDDPGLAAEGVTSSVPITLQLRQKISLRNALRLILEPHRLKAGIHAGVLRVTTQSAHDPVYVQTYRVKDLIGLPTRAPGETTIRELDYADLSKLITSIVAPNSWQIVGGPGAIKESPNHDSLVISNSREVHQQITGLLQQLRNSSRRVQGSSDGPSYQRFPEAF